MKDSSRSAGRETIRRVYDKSDDGPRCDEPCGMLSDVKRRNRHPRSAFTRYASSYLTYGIGRRG